MEWLGVSVAQMDWISIAVVLCSALAGFAAGYGALRAIVSNLDRQLAALNLTMNSASLTIQTVVNDAEHFGKQLTEQQTTIKDLDERLRALEIALAKIRAC